MIHWNYLLSLEQDIARLSNYIEICDDNFDAYSIEILKLNLSIGSEIDVVLKGLCKLYKPDDKFENIKDYKIFINENLSEIIEEEIYIPRFGISLQPWCEIEQSDNDQFKSPFWWDSYNNVKHHRGSDYREANLKNLINSFSALMIVNLYRMIKVKQETNLPDLLDDLPYTVLFKFKDEYYPGLLRHQ